jgi:tetratricopeptide (TPR) repeat protein
MGLGTMLKANKAYRAQRNGNKEEAIRLYEECFADGLNDARFILSYAVLIIRDGQYQKAKDFLVAHQKAPGMTPDQRVTLIVDYAACCFRLGEMDKAVRKMEELHRKGPSGLVYQTLGYLYVEQFDAGKKAAFLARETERQEQEDPVPVRTEDGDAETPAPMTAEDKWEAGRQKALSFNREAVEYDDEDPICLDNLGQVWYRVMENPAEARPWFEKAHRIKPEQIDTLFFLSRYDLEAGDRAAAVQKLEKAAEGRFSPLNYCSREQIAAEIRRLKEA